MSQVKLVSPLLAYGTKLITFEKDYKSGEPNYGQGVLEAISPYSYTRSELKTFFDNIKMRLGTSNDDNRMTDFEVMQLVAFLHQMNDKVVSLQDLVPLPPAWIGEIGKILTATDLTKLLGANGHSGMEHRHMMKLYYQFLNLTLYTWLSIANQVVDVRTASVSEVEKHVMRMLDADIRIRSQAMLRMATLAMINAAIHTLVCCDCTDDFRKALSTQIVSGLIDDSDRSVMKVVFPCGAAPLMIHSLYPAMTKIGVPAPMKLKLVFDAPEKRVFNERVPGIGMRSIPAVYKHIVAYELVPELADKQFYHIDQVDEDDWKLSSEEQFRKKVVDFHTHAWFNESHSTVVPIDMTSPILKELVAATANAQSQICCKFTIPILAAIDGLTCLAIKTRALLTKTGELDPTMWSQQTKDLFRGIVTSSKLPNPQAVRLSMLTASPPDQTIMKYFLRALAAGCAIKPIDGNWEYSQKYVTYQLEVLKDRRVDLPKINVEFTRYLDMILN